MTGINVASILIPRLLDMNFVVHRYNSRTTTSIYLKLDYGVARGIRIADHPGKKKYSYKFNIIKDFKGNKVILKNGLVCNFYDFSEIEQVLEDIQKEKQDKIRNYGINNYNLYMKKNSKLKLYKRFKEIKKER